MPSAAIQRGAPGTFVYVVKDDHTVTVTPVKLGPAQGEITVVTSGVAPGMQVVVDGADKLREGAKVELITREGQAVAPPKAAGPRGPPRRAPGGRGHRRERRERKRPTRRSAARLRPAADRARLTPRSGVVEPGARHRRRNAMNPSRLFILRPVATTLLMVAILLAGIVAYRVLPLSALPEVDYPTIQVVTLYPGASPDVMASSVTAPLERQFGQMPGLNQMSSTSSGGASVITLQFSLALSLDVAEQEVQAAINASSNFLPTDLPARRSTTRSIRPTRRSSRWR